MLEVATVSLEAGTVSDDDSATAELSPFPVAGKALDTGSSTHANSASENAAVQTTNLFITSSPFLKFLIDNQRFNFKQRSFER